MVHTQERHTHAYTPRSAVSLLACMLWWWLGRLRSDIPSQSSQQWAQVVKQEQQAQEEVVLGVELELAALVLRQ